MGYPYISEERSRMEMLWKQHKTILNESKYLKKY